MEEQAIASARLLAERYVQQLGGDMIDSRTLMCATIAGYLAGSGVPTDQAVAAVDQMMAKNLVTPVAANPMYKGLPWYVPGPVSGAPYYS